jgi:hypothetical protein
MACARRCCGAMAPGSPRSINEAFLGRADKTLPAIERAMRLDPMDLWHSVWFFFGGFAELLLGHTEGSITLLHRAAQQMPARHKQIGERAGHDQAMGVLFEPRDSAPSKPNTRLMTPIGCSTLAFILDLFRFFARSLSFTTPRWSTGGSTRHSRWGQTNAPRFERRPSDLEHHLGSVLSHKIAVARR